METVLHTPHYNLMHGEEFIQHVVQQKSDMLETELHRRANVSKHLMDSAQY